MPTPAFKPNKQKPSYSATLNRPKDNQYSAVVRGFTGLDIIFLIFSLSSRSIALALPVVALVPFMLPPLVNGLLIIHLEQAISLLKI